MLPSSAINGVKQWNPNTYKQFATKLGVFPPQQSTNNYTWPMILYPYMKNKDIIWCPNEFRRKRSIFGIQLEDRILPRPTDPNAVVSYWYKAAIDAAWFGGPSGKGPECRKEGDFAFPADQIVFYEHAGWHWGDVAKGLSNGVTINCTYMDGHVQSKRIENSTNAPGQSDPLAPGEPGWFNCDYTNKTRQIGRAYGPLDELSWNPKKSGDNLP
jgi:hypothetical protein